MSAVKMNISKLSIIIRPFLQSAVWLASISIENVSPWSFAAFFVFCVGILSIYFYSPILLTEGMEILR